MFDTYRAFGFQVVADGTPVPEDAYGETTSIRLHPEQEFTFRITNNADTPTLWAVTFKGVSTCTGRVAQANIHGYPVGAESVLPVPGWTMPDDEIYPFKIGQFPKEYETQLGGVTSEGIIIASVYVQQHEHGIPPFREERRSPQVGFVPASLRPHQSFVLRYLATEPESSK